MNGTFFISFRWGEGSYNSSNNKNNYIHDTHGRSGELGGLEDLDYYYYLLTAVR